MTSNPGLDPARLCLFPSHPVSPGRDLFCVSRTRAPHLSSHPLLLTAPGPILPLLLFTLSLTYFIPSSLSSLTTTTASPSFTAHSLSTPLTLPLCQTIDTTSYRAHVAPFGNSPCFSTLFGTPTRKLDAADPTHSFTDHSLVAFLSLAAKLRSRNRPRGLFDRTQTHSFLRSTRYDRSRPASRGPGRPSIDTQQTV